MLACMVCCYSSLLAISISFYQLQLFHAALCVPDLSTQAGVTCQASGCSTALACVSCQYVAPCLVAATCKIRLDSCLYKTEVVIPCGKCSG